MTMPNPVAEVVERLRWYARHYFSHVPRYETLTLDRCMSINEMLATAADEIERLSRERDTGVPEIKTALGIAHAALTAHTDWHLKQIEPQTIDGMEIVPADAYCDSTLYELTQDALHHVERMEAKLSAAPQPPTVSEGASSDLPDEIYVERDAETNEKRWFSCKGMGEKYVHARLLDNWKFVAKHGLAKVTPEHTWAQWLAEMKADLSTLTRERDQAREALAPFAKVLDAMEHDNQLCEEEIDSVLAGTGIVPSDLRRARSVLHPDTEVSS